MTNLRNATSTAFVVCVAALLLVFAPSSLEAKQLTQSIPFFKLSRNNDQLYLTKFSLDIGLGSFRARIRFNKQLLQSKSSETTAFTIGIVQDDTWEAYQEAVTCKQKLELVRVSQVINIPNDGQSWSQEIVQNLHQYARRRTYFFILMDCDKNMTGKNPTSLKFETDINILNVDESHFSSEEEGFVFSFFIIFVACSVFFGLNMQKMMRQYKKEEEYDWPFIMSNLTLLFQVLYIFFEWLHLLIYSVNGNGSFVLQLFGQIFGIASQFTMAIIFILISWGWTINYTELENFDIYIPLAVLLGIVHMMIVGLSKLTDDESHKYHQYGGFVGWIIVVLRLGMFIYFLFGIRDSMRTAREKVKAFIMKFTIFGSLYFLAFPMILFISSFIASYVQHRVITIGTLIMQSIAIIVMSLLFTSKSGDYYNASLRSNPLLPTGKND